MEGDGGDGRGWRGMEGDGGGWRGMVPLAESVRRHIQTGQVKELEKLSGGEGSKLKMLHSVMGDRIPDPIWIGARNKIFSESKSGIFAHQNSSGLTIEFNANHVFLSLPRGVSSTPPCSTLIGSTIHMLPSHVHVLGVGSVLWVGGGGGGEKYTRLINC